MNIFPASQNFRGKRHISATNISFSILKSLDSKGARRFDDLISVSLGYELRDVMDTYAALSPTRLDAQLPQSRAGGQGL